MEKVILTTGGTGGHIFPALAVAEELRSRYPAIKIIFMGSEKGPEARLAPAHGISFEGMKVKGFLGRGFRAVPAAFNMLRALYKAHFFIKKNIPNVIAGFGGYASFAPMLAGHFLHIPLLLHEQNAIPGSCNRLLSKFANSICVSMKGTQGFSKATIYTGNPVRDAIFKAKKNSASNDGPLHLLILGGSQGAHGINLLLKKLLPQLKGRNIEIIHQCGQADLGDLQNAYIEAGYGADCVKSFIDDMAGAYSWADFAICRAGASTIAELCATALPAIFIPFPAAIHDHQTKNAQNLVDNGAALLFQEARLSPSELMDCIDVFARDREKLAKMSENTARLAKKDAARLLVNELEKIAV